jgi:hypothetical protein
MEKWVTWGALVWGVLAAGCAVDAGNGVEGDEERLGSTSQALLGGWATGPFAWSQAVPARRLESASTHVCVLTRMSGKFEGTGELLQVRLRGSDWYLEGMSKQSGVSGEATCFPRGSFFDTCSKPVCPTTQLLAPVNAEAWTRLNAEDCILFEEPHASGSAFSFLTSIQGKMWGGGEWAAVVQSPSVNTPSFLQVGLCAPDSRLYGSARGFSVPATTGLATFVARDGTRGDLNAVPEYWSSGNGSVVMARASKAMCAFTSIQGGFRGNGEVAQIRSELVGGVEHWVLRTSQGANNREIGAGARCFARFQL